MYDENKPLYAAFLQNNNNILILRLVQYFRIKH